VHIAYPDVGIWVPVPCHCDEAGRSIDARTVGSPQMGEFKGEASAARDTEEPVPLADAEPVLNGDVLAAVARLAQGCEADRPAPPSLRRPSPSLSVGRQIVQSLS
jgi:hypothetical protein